MSQVVEHHLPFVRRVARGVTRRSRASPVLDFDDLVQAGVVGLMEAAERFDPNCGVPFRAFARKRVVGAMHDELRRANRSPAPTVSLDASGHPGSGEPLVESIAQREREDAPGDADAAAELPPPNGLGERGRVVVACVAAGYRLTEIGTMLGISPSRVRQLLDAVGSRNATAGQRRLSARERQVLAATAEGLTAKEVAKRLSISPATVQDHRRNAATKLGARNTTHAVAVAYEKGVLPLSSARRTVFNGQ